MQPKCPKCGNELLPCVFLHKIFCTPDCGWSETTIGELKLTTKDQEVYSIAQTILDYLESQAIRKEFESDRLTAIEEKLMDLERKLDK
jgi:hypothetical protein